MTHEKDTIMSAPEVTGFELTWTDGQEPGADATWVPALVPGGVHESLLAAGIIEDPYREELETSVAWMEDATWWYRTSFEGTPGARVELHFACLDTYAEVRLNGSVVGTARNQHRPHAFPVVLAATNELLVRFDPPLPAALSSVDLPSEVQQVNDLFARIRPDDPPLTEDAVALRAARPQVRKATFSWGWDFALRLPSIGILSRVTLRSEVPVLEDLHVRYTDLDVTARTVRLQVSSDAPAPSTVEVIDPDGAVVATLRSETPGVDVDLPLRDVRLWWSHDLGSPDLYTVRVTCGDVERSLRIGFRTIEVDRSPDPDEDARFFRFLLNGLPTFARGACWVPPSMLVGSMTDETTTSLVELARDGGMTMLRVWGGGVYPSEAFYDACDRLGVLVWQDFMFACFDYPDDSGTLVAETRLEAEHQVRRLRHHASLALWCGENEVQGIHEIVHGVLLPRERGADIFLEVLPDVVGRLDPARTYWPGSPWAERDDELLNGTRDGDRHAWEGWHGSVIGNVGGPTEFSSMGEKVHWTRYDHDPGRFISEFGIHASPELATLRRWAGDADLSLGSSALEHRIKDTPKTKGFDLIDFEAGLPTTVEDYVDVSMACQAEGLKHGVEHYRRRQPHCSGTLVWQFNDPWPGLSWSVIDYDLVPKAGYYALQRAYAPVLASFAVADGVATLWISNSGHDEVALDLTVGLGAVSSAEHASEELSVTAAAYSSAPVWTSPLPLGTTDVVWVRERSGLVPANRRFGGRLKELPLTSAVVDAEVLKREDDRVVVRVSASTYAYAVRLQADHPGVRFSTNYVDLLAGESVDIEVSGVRDGTRLALASYCQPAVEVS